MRIKTIERCRICGNRDLIPIIDLGVQALSGRFPASDEPDPPKAPLQVVKCNSPSKSDYCGLVQLKHSVAPGEMFGQSYGYRSGVNRTMMMHLRGVVQSIQQMIGLRPGDIVVDIGSNDATLLKYYEMPGLRRIGIDPAGEQFAEHYTEDIQLVSDYFSSSNYHSISPSKRATVVTSIAMFYDLEAPMSFVGDVKEILDSNGIWVFEQSYLPAMLRMNSVDTICHEHLENYALKQIDWMLTKSDLRILDIDFNEINGGSFRVYACHTHAAFKSNDKKVDLALLNEKKLRLDSQLPYKEFSKRVFGMKDELYSLLSSQKAQGKSIYVYGASTKGNVLLQFCSIDSSLITAAADRNPEKWGRRTPGTHIPIISEEEARKGKPDYFLVLPWHFRSEFIEREKAFLSGVGRFIFPLPEIEIV